MGDVDDTPEVDAASEWGEEAPTRLDSGGFVAALDAESGAVATPVPETPTGKRPIDTLPGYRPGYERGVIAGARMVLDEMADVLIQGGTDIGIAALVVQELRRRLGLKN